jgi:Helix-turn-helix.
MRDAEYRAAYEAEEVLEQLQETLHVWRVEAGLTSAEVAERMGIKPLTVSRMEKMRPK